MRLGHKNVSRLIKLLDSQNREDRKQAYLDIIGELLPFEEVVTIANLAIKKSGHRLAGELVNDREEKAG